MPIVSIGGRTRVLVGVLAAGCAHDPPAPASPQAISQPEAAPLPQTLAPLADAVATRSVIVFGDLHGTRQIPAFVGDVVEALAADHEVALGLEIARDGAPILDAYLEGDGSQDARAALLDLPGWRGPFFAGRSSTAMVELIERARVLRSRGASVAVFAFSVDSSSTPSAGSADRIAAKNVIAARKANPEAVVVILVGSTHAARASLAVRPDYRWMAGELVDAGVPVVSLAPRWTSGSVAWNCVGSEPSDCHPRAADSPLSSAEGIHLETSDDGNYDGWFGVGTLEASPPAALPARSTEVTATP